MFWSRVALDAIRGEHTRPEPQPGHFCLLSANTLRADHQAHLCDPDSLSSSGKSGCSTRIMNDGTALF
ncbi:hypothetical protein A0U92_01205 [Acetobacter aceti]|uniref:Uncharacterized protein n=1 Tax=Acetobacter aceti TaxID=435 RepID=A0A1U9KCS1_ACEAC|nr:hypothetical protein A0U92_01205 [Acetobacter aceti]